jgi:hypothetical protein
MVKHGELMLFTLKSVLEPSVWKFDPVDLDGICRQSLVAQFQRLGAPDMGAPISDLELRSVRTARGEADHLPHHGFLL